MQTTKEEFWNWFDENKTSLEVFISEGQRSYEIYEQLSDKLNGYSEFLIPELTMDKEDRFILVISCDGMKQGIPDVEALTENVRIFDNWVIVKYRQPSPMKRIPFGGVSLKRKNIYLTWSETVSNKYQIVFFVRGYNEQNQHYEGATILHMDHSIGEYNAMTRIEGVTIKKLGLWQSKKDLKTLDDLAVALGVLL